MSKVSSSKLTEVSKAASDVILAISGNHPDIRCDDARRIIAMYDALNDSHAHPAVVKAMADDLLNCRQQNAILHHEADEAGQSMMNWRERAIKAESQLKKMTCNHGYPPGAHTMGKIGCVDCCGRDVYIWEHAHLPGKHAHDIANFNYQYLLDPTTKQEGNEDDA